MDIINKGSDLEGLQISLSNDDGSPMHFDTMTSIEIFLTDAYRNLQAQYIMPYSNQEGYHELRNPEAGLLEFDIHKEDSQAFKYGALYASIRFNSPDSHFPNGYQPEFRNILIAKVIL